MTRLRFEEDPAFRGALLRSTGVRAVLEEVVADAADLAGELAPDDPETGGKDLHTSIYGDVGMTSHGWAGRVGALNFKAPWLEEGNARTAPQPFLRPAVEAKVGPIEASPLEDEE